MKKLFLALVILLAVSIAGTAQAKELPKLDDGQVIMKWSDFEKILKELLKPEEKPEPKPEEKPVPPVQYTFSSADLKIVIGDGFTSIEAEYSLDVLAEKTWVSVPLGQGSSGIHKVLIDGKAALISGRSGRIEILLLGKGSHRVKTSYTVTAPQNPGPNSIYVPIASIPGAKITLTAPVEISDIAINGAVITDSKKTKSAQNISAISGATQSISLSYTVPTPEALAGDVEKLPSKLYSTVEILVSIADEVTTARANFHYDIKHSPMSRFSIAVPEGYDVVNVTGQGVSGWKIDDENLVVNINYEVQGSYYMQVHLESKREKASGSVVLPEPITIDAERESGFVAVETRSSLEVAIQSMDGIVPIDATELPQSLHNRAKYPILYSFRFGRHPYSGELSVIRHDEVQVLNAAIDTVNLVTLFTDDGKTVTRMIYEIRNNKQQYIKIDLPDKAKVWSAFLDKEPVKPSINKKGQVLMPLKKSGSDGKKISFTVELIYYVPISEMERWGKLNIKFPKADIPASEMLVSLYLPPKYKYWKFEGDLEVAITIMEPELVPLLLDKKTGKSEIKEMKRVPMKKAMKLWSNRALERQNQIEQEIADEIQMYDGSGLSEEDFDDRGAYDKALKPKGPPGSTMLGRRGMLPVKFNVPLRGEIVRLSKLLVMDEAPELTFRYRKKLYFLQSPKTRKAGKVVFSLSAIMALLYLTVRLRKRYRRKPEKPSAPPANTTGSNAGSSSE